MAAVSRKVPGGDFISWGSLATLASGILTSGILISGMMRSLDSPASLAAALAHLAAAPGLPCSCSDLYRFALVGPSSGGGLRAPLPPDSQHL